MGVDCGFDMVPPLTGLDSDTIRWRAFIEKIKEIFQNDPVVQLQPRFIEFQVGEHPLLPFEGHKFLRFSSKISGFRSAAAEPYIDDVYRLARTFFGEQVRFWHELNEGNGFYDWKAVHESFKSYYDSPTISSAAASPSDDGPNSTENQVLAEPFTATLSYISIPIPDKGQGLVAAQDIPKGSRILSEEPIFTVPKSGFNDKAMNQTIANKLNQLSKDNQRAFLALHNSFRGSMGPFVGIVKTNALPFGPDATEGGIFLQASRINHACLPNCQHTWNASIGKETIHAVSDIAKDEEITISYTESGPYQDRRKQLQLGFGFECTCNLCSLPKIHRMLSDDRMKQIRDLDIAIGNGAHLLQYPQQHLQKVNLLVTLLEAEKISDARLPRAYYDAFQTVIAHRDSARAKIFANRAFAARLVCEGEDSPSTLKIKRLAENPESHRLFGTSRRWSQKETKVPKGLSDDEFEIWLWRQNA